MALSLNSSSRTISLVIFMVVAVGSWLARHFSWYSNFWYTDVILHILSGIAFGYMWIWFNKRSRQPFSGWLFAFSVVLFACFGSYLWEVWEYAGWKLFPAHVNFYQPELGDSLSDIGCGVFGGLLAALYDKINK